MRLNEQNAREILEIGKQAMDRADNSKIERRAHCYSNLLTRLGFRNLAHEIQIYYFATISIREDPNCDCFSCCA